MSLQLNELLLTERSELAAIEDENHVVGAAMIAQRDEFIIYIRKRKIRSFITDLISNNTLSAAQSAKHKYNYQEQAKSVVYLHLS